MIEFLFQPESVSAMAMLILTGAIFTYLISIRKKSAATNWLLLSIFGFWLYWLHKVLTTSLSPAITTVPIVNDCLALLFGIGLGLAFWPFMMFGYHFLENPYPKEAKVVVYISGALVTISVLYFTYTILFIELFSLLTFVLFYVATMLSFSILGIAVLIRKNRRAKKNQNKRYQVAYRNYALLYGLLIVYLFNLTYNFAIPDASLWLTVVGEVALLLFFFGLVITYINYSPEPTSFQVKLIGLSLITTLAVFNLASLILFPDDNLKPFYPDSLTQEALQFNVTREGYQVSKNNMEIDSTDLGTNLNLNDDKASRIPIPFSFPFAGTEWDSLYVSPNGVITFGKPIYGDAAPVFGPAFFYNQIPKMAPFYFDFNPNLAGGVYTRKDSAEVAVTWYKIPPFGLEQERNTIQLILRKNGDFVFNYGDIESNETVQNQIKIRGIAANQPPQFNTSQETPEYLGFDQAWLQHLAIEYRRAINPIFATFIWLLIGFSSFILIIFPFFYKSSLIQPLDRLLKGVRKINDGDLDAKVQVGVRDEIGHLTDNFNRMTDSLRRYQQEMEALVAERTAKLERSLEDLKSTQQQLVQQEKLASLGQLTAGIAHEIKNPLNFVNNFSDLSVELIEEAREELSAVNGQPSEKSGDDAAAVAETLDILDDIEANLKKINEHGSRADGIVKSMLQHSRGGDGEMEPTDLNALIEEYVNLSFHGMRASENPINVDIEMDLDENVGEVSLIAEDFSRVIINLCNNAFDAMRKKQEAVGGKPSSAKASEGKQEAGDYEPILTIRTNRDNGEVTIEIEDNGPGIPEDVRDKILQPFFTTKKGTEGTGLGLSITNDIVKAHGGELEIQSNKDGSVFRIQLNNK